MSQPLPFSSQPTITTLFEGSVQAGFPAPESDSGDRRIDLNEILLMHRESSFLFRVRGDSMKDAGIFDGDALIVDRAVEPRHNLIVLAIVDGEFTVKRLHIHNGRYSLHPENPAFPVIELQEGHELQVWGVVTSSIRRHF